MSLFLKIDLSFLDCHDIICWDLDGTLVANAYSSQFCAYIEAHPEKKHHFVTFRDSEWAQDIYLELRGDVDPKNIAGIHACPEELWVAHSSIILSDSPELIAYIEWKGKTAAEIGGTVLVDDMPQLVLRGCQRYNISFVDARKPFDYAWTRATAETP